MTALAQAAGLEALAVRFGARLSRGEALRRQHGAAEGLRSDRYPDAVLMLAAAGEVAEAVGICAAHALPIIPFGAGSSLEGHLAAVRGGVSFDLSGMTTIGAVCPSSMDVEVEAGVTREALNAHLRDQGLFFPVDPGANATLGGMAATSATGTTTVRYGGMRENVLALEVVLADGRVAHLGTRARKTSAGYDLTRLMIGSEGTLGIITKLRLRLQAIPDATAVVLCAFPTLDAAVSMVGDALQMGLGLARIELLDAVLAAALNAYADLGLREAPTLLIELHGSSGQVAADRVAVEHLSGAHGAMHVAGADAAEERSRLWTARHQAYFAALALQPGAAATVTDVCVPILHLAACIVETRRDIDASGIVGPILGHVGDGNFHAILLHDPGDRAAGARVHDLVERLARRAQAMGGTCTGEHGIGLGKKALLEAEAGPAGIAMMRAIKQALDPNDLLNPGKIFDR